MAKQQQPLNDPFARTGRGGEPDQELAEIDLDESPVKSTGLGIRTGEWKALNLIAKRHGVTINKLVRFFLRYCITQVRDGKLDLGTFLEIPPEPKRDLKMPD
jgi:hypothetical protein